MQNCRSKEREVPGVKVVEKSREVNAQTVQEMSGFTTSGQLTVDGGAERGLKVEVDLQDPALDNGYTHGHVMMGSTHRKKMDEVPVGCPSGDMLLKAACMCLELKSVWPQNRGLAISSNCRIIRVMRQME